MASGLLERTKRVIAAAVPRTTIKHVAFFRDLTSTVLGCAPPDGLRMEIISHSTSELAARRHLKT